jgi:hypothetical protein
MGGSSSPPPANTTSSTTQNPWQGAKPYLEGGRGEVHIDGGKQHTGIFPLAENYFNQYGKLSPQQIGTNASYANQLGARSGAIGQRGQAIGQQFLGGQFDPRAGMTAGRTAAAAQAQAAQAQAAQAQAAQAQAALGQSYQGNLQSGMQNLGGNNPQQALGRLLSGLPDNPYLGAMHQANINQSLRGYNDAISNLTQSVLPQLGGEAFASGGYGGSRQGIAEGMALSGMQRNARDLGIAAMDSGNQLYGGAYESAQGRMGDAASMLTGQAADMERFNAGQLQQGSQFNAGQQQQTSQYNTDALNAMRQFNAGNVQQANLSNRDALNAMRQFNAGNMQQANQFNAGQWQNADQFNANLDMQQQAARAQNAKQGMDIFKDQYAMQDNIFNQLQSIYGAPRDQYQNALNQYANIVSPGAAMGGSSLSNSQIPIYGNSTGQIFGGAASLAGLLGSLK